MQRHALEVLGCPECSLPFTDVSPASETIEMGTLRCARGHEFAVSEGVPMLVRESDRPHLVAFADSYAGAWVKNGWGSPDPDYLIRLPYHDMTRRRASEWRVKARSMEALFHVLHPERWPRVIDVGAGMGWFSHQLAVRGHETYACDAVLDSVLGLRAAETYVRTGPRFERVWGDFLHLPFLSSSVDAVVYNASLHYTSDLAGALKEVARVLKPGGLLAVLNSPVYRRIASTARAQSDFRAHLRSLGASNAVVSTYHHFVRSELESIVAATVGSVGEIPFNPGRRFRWSRRLKGLALRMELASFPILVATKSKRPTSSQ